MTQQLRVMRERFFRCHGLDIGVPRPRKGDAEAAAFAGVVMCNAYIYSATSMAMFVPLPPERPTRQTSRTILIDADTIDRARRISAYLAR
jgi:hypothetical protein